MTLTTLDRKIRFLIKKFYCKKLFKRVLSCHAHFYTTTGEIHNGLRFLDKNQEWPSFTQRGPYFGPDFSNHVPDLGCPLDQELWFNQQSPNISNADRILVLNSVSGNFEMARLENCSQIMLIKIPVRFKFSKL